MKTLMITKVWHIKNLLFIATILSSCPLLSQEIGARYLIITHDDYYDELQPLAQWKTQKGLKAKIVTLSEIGNDSTEIRDYIINAYNLWSIQPEYLLLVGNKYQIPFPSFLHPGSIISHSDNYYTNISGDFHNEIIPGRLWVNNDTEAAVVVSKILGYENDPYLTDSLWFRKGVTIVNEDDYPPYSDSVYWADARYARTLMSNAGFTHIDSFAQSLGNTGTDVIAAMNEGRSYILYRGFGVGNWLSPFNNIGIQDMQNGSKLPIVISATCATVEGIGYAWLNAGSIYEPKGTVGFFGTTTVLGGAAEMRSALTHGTLEKIFCDSLATLGEAAEAGRLNYYALFQNLIEYHSWTCLGDPEMNLLTSTPKTVQILTNETLHSGLCTLIVNIERNSIPVHNALVCAMAAKDTLFYNYGRTDTLGTITFIDIIHETIDSVYVTVTGRNLKAQTTIIPVSGTSLLESRGWPIQYHTTIESRPNPFKQITDIRYEITDREHQRPELKIYDVSGRLVRDFSERLSVIGHPSSVKWDGTDNIGKRVPEGIYFVRLQGTYLNVTKKVIRVE